MLQNKKLITLIGIIIIILVLPLALFILNQQTQLRSQAEKTTTLSFEPDTAVTPLEINKGENQTIDIVINPGQNLVSTVKLDIELDQSKITYSGSNAFTPNSNAFPVTVEEPVYEKNKMTVTLSIGSDPTRAVREKTSVGTLTLTGVELTDQDSTNVIFTNETQVFSLAPNDEAAENVLSIASPARILVVNKPITVENCTLPENTLQGEVFESVLTGTNQVPPNNSTAVGRARVVVQSHTHIYITHCYRGLSSKNTRSSIHYPARADQSATERIELENSRETDFTEINRRSGVKESDLILLRDGLWYINVRSDRYSNGEIRGHFQKVASTVPTTSPSQSNSPTPTGVGGPQTPSLTPTISPTQTISGTPTSTGSPVNGLTVDFSIFLHGIGSSGDSINPANAALSNKNPLTKQRSVQLEALNAQNQKVADTVGTVTFSSQSGNFVGKATFANLPNGTYTLQLKTDKFLRRTFPGFHTLSQQTNNLPSITLIAGDVNGDNVINIVDYNILIGCYSDLAPAKSCTPTTSVQSDLTDDGKVNQNDYNLFIREMSVQGGA